MFERFTDRARRIIVLAQEEARSLSHNYIGTEHILLGMLHEGDGVAGVALKSLNVDRDGLRKKVVEIIGIGQMAPSGHIPFTPRAKKVMELALREALQLGHNYIGTEHLLLGLIREGEGVAAQVLVTSGVELNLVRRTVLDHLAGIQEAAEKKARAEEPSVSRLVATLERLALKAAETDLDGYSCYQSEFEGERIETLSIHWKS
jgi:ATP-dependent Clp protease ATP-binding subunit ClpC